MTWKTLTELLSAEFRKLRRMTVVSFGFTNALVTNPAELRAEELRQAARVDAIARDFARTSRWPALDEKERYFLIERVRFACEYAMIAQGSVRRPILIASHAHVLNEQRRIMEWLLIQAWRESGVLNWLEPLFIICQSNPRVAKETDLQISE
jgi:hypothetical protein